MIWDDILEHECVANSDKYLCANILLFDKVVLGERMMIHILFAQQITAELPKPLCSGIYI